MGIKYTVAAAVIATFCLLVASSYFSVVPQGQPAPGLLHRHPLEAENASQQLFSSSAHPTAEARHNASPPPPPAPPKFANDKCPPFDRTMWSIDADFDAEPFCAKYGETALARGRRPLIYYGIMFGYEFDMLEIVLHEAYPVVDKFILVESTVTHSVKQKATHFHTIRNDPRFEPFLTKMVNFTFAPRKKYKSGWDIEKRQRKLGLKGAFDSGIRNGDIFIGNMDLDEPFQAHYLMRLKYCNVKTLDFYQFQFRYHLNCIQVDKISTNHDVNFRWGPSALHTDLYKSRQSRTHAKFAPRTQFANEMSKRDGYVSWHMGTFGSIASIMKKLENSPHRFLAEFSEEAIRSDVSQCKYNNEPKWKVVQNRSLLPKFIQKNMCHFRSNGWLPGEVQ